LNDRRPLDGVLVELTALVQAGVLPDRAQDLGTRLLHRMTSPIRLALFGPSAADRAEVGGQLQGLSADEITLANTPEQGFAQVDIALWVTRHFGPDELAIWSTAPDILKDHSYLVCLGPLNDHLFDCAVEEFLELVPLDLAQGAKAGAALAQLLAERVRQGRQADQDNATLFVETHKALVSGGLPPAVAAPRQPDPPDVPTQSPDADLTKNVSGTAPESTLYHAVADQIRAHALDIAQLPLSEAAEDCVAVLELCSAAAEGLSDVVTEDPTDAPQDLCFKEDILTAVDSLVLMSLEQGVGPAVDAVTTLLQIKRSAEAQIAS